MHAEHRARFAPQAYVHTATQSNHLGQANLQKQSGDNLHRLYRFRFPLEPALMGSMQSIIHTHTRVPDHSLSSI